MSYIGLPAYLVSDLKKLIKEHVDAQIEMSWKGGKMPDEWPGIEERAKRAEERLDDFIRRELS